MDCLSALSRLPCFMPAAVRAPSSPQSYPITSSPPPFSLTRLSLPPLSATHPPTPQPTPPALICSRSRWPTWTRATRACGRAATATAGRRSTRCVTGGPPCTLATRSLSLSLSLSLSQQVPAALPQPAPSPLSLPFSLDLLSPRALSLPCPSLYYIGAPSGRQPAAADAGGRRARAHGPRS